MKRLIFFLLLATYSASAFAQFPLGGKEKDIRAYFNKRVAYSSIENVKTTEGISGVRFHKPKGIGDYTFFFDSNGDCISYVVTYSTREFDDIVDRLNATFKPAGRTTWTSDNNNTRVTVLLPHATDNYFSVVYSGPAGYSQTPVILASN